MIELNMGQRIRRAISAFKQKEAEGIPEELFAQDIRDLCLLLVHANNPVLYASKAKEVSWEFGDYEVIVRKRRLRKFFPAAKEI